jgi:hypothetical protein
MDITRLRMRLIFWLLAPAALMRRVRRRQAGWVRADGNKPGQEL